MEIPETKFTKVGEDRIAYQVVGEGPVDLLLVSPTGNAVDLQWDWPAGASFLRRLASFSRLIMFDRRGWGASDSISHGGLPPWEEWADDVRAVLDAVGSERAAIFGIGEVGATAVLFAATEPERTSSLLLFNATARFLADRNYPGNVPEADLEMAVRSVREIWGTEASVALGLPSMVDDQLGLRWQAKAARLAASARVAASYFRSILTLDVREVLSSIRVPTLVIHRKHFRWIPAEQGRYVAGHIPEARFVLVPGADGTPVTEPSKEILDSIEEFLTGARPIVEPDRVLAAVLFTDIVRSTERAAALGDRRWKEVLQSHDTITRSLIEQHRGRAVKTTGDGFLATFDGPGRAIRCVIALQEALRPLGIEIRAGLHTGEIELMGEDIGGIGVHVAARVASLGAASEVLVSRTVTDLVAGSGIEFEDRGSHELKGVPGEWQLFAVRT